MATLDTHFQQFLRERTYLKNVSPKTRVWYESAWTAFLRTQGQRFAQDEVHPASLTRAHLTTFVVASRDRGLRPVTVNTWLRALNAFGRWLHAEGVLRERAFLQPLRIEKRLVKTHDDAMLRALLSFKPVGYAQWRVHTSACTIIDTGCRIEEVLTARVRDFDLDNLLLTVIGKGNKQRIVPFSFELRKRLVRFSQVKAKHGVGEELMFAARDGGACYSAFMERSKFEFDHELAAQQRTRLKESVHDAAHAEYRATTESMLRATAKVLFGVCGLFGLLFLLGWALSK